MTASAKISKHRAYRSRTKARAIALKGGRCERCGFSDERALRFHHTKPVRRGSNGLSRKALTSTETHRAIVRGEGGKSVRLLCANCSCIDTAKDWTLNLNTKRAAAPLSSSLPAAGPSIEHRHARSSCRSFSARRHRMRLARAAECPFRAKQQTNGTRRSIDSSAPIAAVRRTTIEPPESPSRPGELHPEPLTDPDLILSHHPARATVRRLPPSVACQVPPVAG